MVWVIPFCSPVAELNRWLGTQKLSGGDRSAQTTQVHINSPRIHLHTPPNPNCSRLYDHEWSKADYNPDSPPPFVQFEFMQDSLNLHCNFNAVSSSNDSQACIWFNTCLKYNYIFAETAWASSTGPSTNLNCNIWKCEHFAIKAITRRIFPAHAADTGLCLCPDNLVNANVPDTAFSV